MKLLVTGANGFVGSRLVPFLKSCGHDVSVAVRQDTGNFKNCYVVKDLAAISEELLSEHDGVVHLAGVAHTRLKSANAQYKEINTDMACLLADRAANAGCSHFVFLSTAKVHGQQSIQPFKSSDPLDPRDAYSESKSEAEEYITGIDSNTQFICLRPPVVYGPNSKANIARLKNLVENGRFIVLPTKANVRSFISLDNLCGAIGTCFQAKYFPAAGYLIDDGDSISTEGFVMVLADVGGHRPKLIHLPLSLFKTIDGIAKHVYGSKVLAPLYENFEIKCDAFSNRFGWMPTETRRSAIAKIF